MKKFYSLIAVFILTVGALASAAYLGNVEIWGYLSSHTTAVLSLLLLVCVATIANLTLRWVRWHYLNRRLGVFIPARRSLAIYFAFLPAVLTPLYCGEILRAAVLGNATATPWRNISRIWIIERSGDLAIALALLGASAAAWRLWAMPAALACLLVCYAAISRPGIRHVVRLKSFSLVLLTGTLAWGLTALMLALVLQGLEASLPLWESITIFSQSTILGAISLLPGGVGVTGSSMLGSLAGLGIDPVLAAISVMIFRAGTTWFAVALGAVVFILWRHHLRSTPIVEQDHFDQIADEYKSQISEHVRDKLLQGKIQMMIDTLSQHGIQTGSGLDFGCGQGWYAREMMTRGFAMTGCDASENQLKFAQQTSPQLQLTTLDEGSIGLPDHSVDFIYTINVMHHIEDVQLREKTWRELVRVVKPGGLIMIHEMNTVNPLFRFYLGYVFPLIKSIDEGTEQWLDPTHPPQVEGANWQQETRYFTFLPDFIPTWLAALLAPLEAALEKSRFSHWSAHFFCSLVTSNSKTTRT